MLLGKKHNNILQNFTQAIHTVNYLQRLLFEAKAISEKDKYWCWELNKFFEKTPNEVSIYEPFNTT